MSSAATYPQDECVTRTLPNGVPVIVDHIPECQVTTVSVWIRSGTRAERPPDAGLTHAVEHMALQYVRSGTTLRAAEQIDVWGGFASGETGTEQCLLYATVPTSRGAAALQLLAEGLTQPFDADVWRAEREVILDESRRAISDPELRAVAEFYLRLYPGQAIGRSPIGDPQRLALAEIGEIEVFRTKTVHSGTVGVVVSGGLDADEASKAAQVLASLPPGSFSWADSASIASTRTEVRLVLPGGATCICVGGAAEPVGSEKRLLDDAALATLVGSAAARLYRRVRSELGLAYLVDGHASHYSDVGCWRAVVTTSHPEPDFVLNAVRATLGSFETEPPDPAAAADARDFVAGRQLLMTETTYERMSGIGFHRFVHDIPWWSRAADIGETFALDVELVSDRAVDLVRDWLVMTSAGHGAVPDAH